jgi:hypothetical protein
MSSGFGDLKDGVHTGGPEDPRVQLIKVEPYEVRGQIIRRFRIARLISSKWQIRYWYKTRTSVGQLVDVAVSAATGTLMVL